MQNRKCRTVGLSLTKITRNTKKRSIQIDVNSKMHAKISVSYVTEQQTLENISIAASPSGRWKTDSIVILVPPIPGKTRRWRNEMGKDANKDRGKQIERGCNLQGERKKKRKGKMKWKRRRRGEEKWQDGTGGDGRGEERGEKGRSVQDRTCGVRGAQEPMHIKRDP